MKHSRVYTIAVLVTICVILVNQAFIQYWLYQKKADANIINVGGKQRMLSQRLVSMIQDNQSARKVYSIGELDVTYENWLKAHRYLLKQFDSENGIYKKDIRMSLEKLTPRIQFLKKYVDNPQNINSVELQQLIESQDIFLVEMDRIVKVMERDSDRKLNLLIGIEILFALISLALVFYEINFIFKKINTSLLGKNKALTQSNEMLEQYAYLAAHDLRTPSQNIMNFSKVLQAKLGDKLDEKEKQYFTFIDQASERLGHTTSDLLQFSSVNQEEIKKDTFDTSEFISDVINAHKAEIASKGAIMDIGFLPPHLYADRQLLFLIFQNLISNALKFIPDQTTPHIIISGVAKKKEYIISIKDNGIGINPENQTKIFGMFKRLHRQEEYAGTGIGLSICRLVVEKHGGTITLESEEGKGSTFNVHLPKS